MPSLFLKSCPLCSHTNLKKIHFQDNATLLKCENCTHVFFDTIPDENQLLVHYNKYPVMNEVHELTKRNYRTLLTSIEKYKKTGNILDFGCSEGHFLLEAKKFGWNVYGVELIDRCIKTCTDKGIKILNFGEFNAVEDGFFDVITAHEVIEHLSDPDVFFKTVYKKLREGGLFMGTTPNFNSITRKIKKFDWRVIDYPDHLMYFNPTSLQFLLNKNNFKSLKITTQNLDVLTWFVDEKQIQNSSNNQDKIDEIREKFEKGHIKALKKFMNFLLNLFKIGDNLKWFAEKSIQP